MTTRHPGTCIDFDDLKAEVDASYTPEQRKEYEDAESDVKNQIELAERVYKMRAEAGISQAELTRRMEP